MPSLLHPHWEIPSGGLKFNPSWEVGNIGNVLYMSCYNLDMDLFILLEAKGSIFYDDMLISTTIQIQLVKALFLYYQLHSPTEKTFWHCWYFVTLLSITLESAV